MTKIFLSYRRDDTSGYVGRLADRLCARFGRDSVFRDLDSIAPGRDFTIAINEAIGSCDAVVAVIGRNWMAPTGLDGRRRIDDPDDYVRVEITAALERQVRVIPVLVDRAGMPSPESLPPPLAPLARRNALEVSESRWDYDVQRLIDVLDPSSPETLTGSVPVVTATPAWRRRTLAAVGGVVLLALAAVAFLSRGSGHRTISASTNHPITTTTQTTLAPTTIPAAGDGQGAPGGTPAAGGQATGRQPTQQPAPGRQDPASSQSQAQPSPAPVPPPAPTPQPASPNADAVAGSWSGNVSDGGGGTFRISLDVRTGCGVGEKCGSVYVSNNNCLGDFILYAISGAIYEFTVANFSATSGPNCSAGAGEYLTPQGNGTLGYTTNYGPYGTLSPA